MFDEITQPRVDARGAGAGLALRLAIALALLLLPASVVAQTGSAPKGNPRLASLRIEIWPEYDRPAALVILKGALAEGVKLPAAIALRLPVASGGPAAVAFSATAGGDLLNLDHERASAGEFVTIRFDVLERFFHVEFYEPISTTVPARSYRYAWPGDLAAERVTVVVQEPAGASGLSVEPNLELASTGQEGLRYRAAELGAREAGKPLPIVIHYTKLGMRPSVEIMKPKAGEAPAAAASTPPAASGTSLPGWVLALLAVALLAVGASLTLFGRRRRASRPATLPHGACTQCGAPRTPGGRFCGKCGAKLA